jgi:hypothetical protein
MRIIGPTNDGVSFANIDGNKDEDHTALNTNGQKSKQDWL